MTVKQDQAKIRRLNAKRRALKKPPGATLKVDESGRFVQAHVGPIQLSPSKRLTLSEIIQLLLQRGRAASGGVTLSRNARGIPQFEVSVPTGEECPTIDSAKAKAVQVYEDLEARFPFYEAPSPENGPRKA